MLLGVSGMRNHQLRMDVIGNNIANVNTTGFKTSRANFQDALYQAMGANGSCQVGTGIQIAGVSNNFAQGPLQATGRVLDLAIVGNGFFGLVDENGRIKFTRDGSFYLDKDNNIVHSTGLKLVDSSGDAIELDLDEGQSHEDITITETGEIFVGGSSQGTIALYNFNNLTGLTKAGDNLYLDNDISGEPIEGTPGEEGLGLIRSGFLEMSNIDLADELANLIATQRGYQANARVFTTADQVLQETIDLKR
jgi:flagellar hook protein FlgE